MVVEWGGSVVMLSSSCRNKRFKIMKEVVNQSGYPEFHIFVSSLQLGLLKARISDNLTLPLLPQPAAP